MNEIKDKNILKDIYAADSSLLLQEKTQSFSERFRKQEVSEEQWEEIQYLVETLRIAVSEIQHRYQEDWVDIFFELITIEMKSETAMQILVDIIVEDIFDKKLSAEELTRLLDKINRLDTQGDRRLTNLRKRLIEQNQVLASEKRSDAEISEFRIGILENPKADETLFQIVLGRIQRRLNDHENPLTDTERSTILSAIKTVRDVRFSKKMYTSNEMWDLLGEVKAKLQSI